jgi:hypothetical protein
MSYTIKTIAVDVTVRCVKEDEQGNVLDEFTTARPITLHHPFCLDSLIERVEEDIIDRLEAKK